MITDLSLAVTATAVRQRVQFREDDDLDMLELSLNLAISIARDIKKNADPDEIVAMAAEFRGLDEPNQNYVLAQYFEATRDARRSGRWLTLRGPQERPLKEEPQESSGAAFSADDFLM